MDIIRAVEFSEKAIVVETVDDLQKLYECVEDTNNFILTWWDVDTIGGTVLKSQVIIADNISSKVKTGELKLSSRGK